MPTARLFTGATVLAPEPRPDDSVGVLDGEIVAVGDRRSVAAALPPDHEVVDCAGRTLVPGFVDAHLHPLPWCFFEHHEDLSEATTLEEVFDRLADRAGREPDDGWVVGLRIDDAVLAERRLPTREELDRVGAGRPVVLLRRDGHHAVGSSAALAAAGFAPGVPDPPGGVVHRASDGSLTGLCGESASAQLLAGVPIPELHEFEAALDRIVDRLAAHGVTAVSAICQTTAEGPAGDAGTLEAAAWSMLVDRVPFDLQTILVGADPATVEQHRTGPLHRPQADRRVDAVKLFFDGTLGGHTACMHEPFADGDGRGMLTLEPDDAYRRMEAAHLAGLQVCVHAIGDRANAEALDLFARLEAAHPSGGVNRHRIEHASVLDPGSVERFAELGVSAVVQPISLASERHWLASRLGSERLGRVYPFRDLLDAGVVVAGSSDAPIESSDVIGAMACATDRDGIGPGQTLTPLEALGLYTTGGAWARHAEHRVGRIAPGWRADLVELDRDPRDGVVGLEVVATVCAGEDVHRVPREQTDR